MATRPTTEVQATRADQAPADDLTEAEQKEIRETDTADNARRVEKKELTGKRVRAIPAHLTRSGDVGTTVEIRDVDFQLKGIEHDTVRFDARTDDYTIAVGSEEGQLSEKAAEFLTKNYPYSFEYIGE